jgi:hypothetical protein
MGKGFSVGTVTDANLGGSEDRDVGIYASATGRVLVTGNRGHFKALIDRIDGLQVVMYVNVQEHRQAAALREVLIEALRRLRNGDRWILIRPMPRQRVRGRTRPKGRWTAAQSA